MDFLDSIEVSSTHKKSHRVRSWYLYEQYKSLERHQTDAAKKLKDKSYQDRLLRRELTERRARRRLCNEREARSEPVVTDVSGDISSCVTSSNNDFFESFCEIQHDDTHVNTDGTSKDDQQSTEENCSNKPSSTIILEKKSDDSMPFHVTVSENLADDIKEELEIVKRSIEENINMQLETVKDNLQCLEEFNRLSGSRESSRDMSKYEDYDDDSSYSESPPADDYNNMLALWSRLVSFAYQVVQLNHGNCYYDYSSQFLTAVLACDVLRRGVNKMCNILQPYVSPIKFASDKNSRCSIKIKKYVKRKLSSHMKRKHSKQSIGSKTANKKSVRTSNSAKPASVKSPSSTKIGEKRYHTRNWRQRSLYSDVDAPHIASEPWRSVSADPQMLPKTKCPSTIWPEEFDSKFSEDNFQSCKTRVANPMLKLASYIDDILKDIGDSSL